MALLNPSIGSKVWFYPQQEDLDAGMKRLGVDFFPEPFDATVVYVHSESLVNLHVLDHEGTAWKFENVIMLAGYLSPNFPVRCATWARARLGQAQREDPITKQGANPVDGYKAAVTLAEKACLAAATMARFP